MGDEAEGIHLVPVEEQVHFHQIAGPVIAELIVQGGVALGVGLQSVKEIIDDLIEGHLVVELHQVGIQILHILELSPALLAQGHDIAHIVVGGEDGHLHIGLPGLRNGGGVRIVVGVIHRHLGAVGLGDLVDNRGQGGDEVQVKLPLQPLLDDLAVEHTQKAAAEAKAQCHRALRLEGQGGVVELELLQGVPEIRVLTAVLGVHAAVDHGLGLPVAGQGLGGRIVQARDGVAHLGGLDILDGSGEIAHLARLQDLAGLVAQRTQQAALQHLVLGAGGHHLHVHAPAEGTLHNAEVHDDALIGIIVAVEDQCPEGSVDVAGGGGDILHHVLQHRRDIDAHFGGDLRSIHGGEGQDVLDLVLHPGRIGGREVDLIDHRPDLQVVVHGEVGVGQGLGLNALGGIHYQQSPLAGRQRPADLVVEVHVARGVDEVQGIGLPILGLVVKGHRTGLDGDAPLLLQVHVIQELVFHVPLRHSAALFQQPVRQSGLAMVNVGNNTEISDVFLFYHRVTSI